MEKVYVIGRTTENALISNVFWDKVRSAEVDCYPWDQNGYKPKTEAKVIYTEKGFHVLMTSYENRILGTWENFLTKESINDFSGPSWSVRYFIPFSFIERFFGKLDFKSGKVMLGNFYKCAEDTGFPHFGSWNPVRNATPDFHRPECFGSLFLE